MQKISANGLSILRQEKSLKCKEESWDNTGSLLWSITIRGCFQGIP